MPQSPYLQLKRQEWENRKKLILDTAVELFSQTPIPQVSMRDISKAAGISTALIYRYFTDRDELFVEAFLVKAEEMIDTFRRRLQEQAPMTLETFCVAYVDFLCDNDPFFRMMTHFMLDSQLKDEYVEKFNAPMRRLLSVMDEVFVADGRVQDIRLHTHALFAALNGILITFRRYPGRSDEESRRHIRRLAKMIAKQFERK
ncbi:MAG: TetR/AcrR family transcriptional regulator [Bacillota bacterium]|nr:TetR/AcrR family transcriptional regulator [Bacillota bacterium]